MYLKTLMSLWTALHPIMLLFCRSAMISVFPPLVQKRHVFI